jgi:putative methyltransferase (TIGR04325 family)
MGLSKTIKRITYLLLPPIITQRLVNTSSAPTPRLEFTPAGWRTQIDRNEKSGWNHKNVGHTEKAKWDQLCANLAAAGPLGFSHEHNDLTEVRNVGFHNVHVTYAYVIALTAHHKERISVLDWGGGLGHYYQLAQATNPGVEIDFHCREVPALVEIGRELNPSVTWHADEEYLNNYFDLVMVNGSLQYVEDWQEKLRQLARVAKDYFFLTRLPVVENASSFVAIQREYGTEMLHQQLNQKEVLKFAETLGLKLVREFVVGDKPQIEGAPEQCELRGWLFRREPSIQEIDN